MSKDRKKFKDTKVGKFLLGKSGLLDSIGDVMPDKGLLGVVKNLIDQDPRSPATRQGNSNEAFRDGYD